MLLLKAPTYKMVEENSKLAQSYFYSLESGAQGKKSFYNVMFIGTEHKPFYSDLGRFFF